MPIINRLMILFLFINFTWCFVAFVNTVLLNIFFLLRLIKRLYFFIISNLCKKHIFLQRLLNIFVLQAVFYIAFLFSKNSKIINL